MKKVLMLLAMVLGTTAMVNAQVAPAKTAQKKEINQVKAEKKVVKVEVKQEETKAVAEVKQEKKAVKIVAKRRVKRARVAKKVSAEKAEKMEDAKEKK